MGDVGPGSIIAGLCTTTGVAVSAKVSSYDEQLASLGPPVDELDLPPEASLWVLLKLTAVRENSPLIGLARDPDALTVASVQQDIREELKPAVMNAATLEGFIAQHQQRVALLYAISVLRVVENPDAWRDVRELVGLMKEKVKRLPKVEFGGMALFRLLLASVRILLTIIDALSRAWGECKEVLNAFGRLVQELHELMQGAQRDGDFLLVGCDAEALHDIRAGIAEGAVLVAFLESRIDMEASAPASAVLWALDALLTWRAAMPREALRFDVEQAVGLGLRWLGEGHGAGVLRAVLGDLRKAVLTPEVRQEFLALFRSHSLVGFAGSVKGSFALARLQYALQALKFDAPAPTYWVTNLALEGELQRATGGSDGPTWLELTALFMNEHVDARGVHHEATQAEVESVRGRIRNFAQWLARGKVGAADLKKKAREIYLIGFALDKQDDPHQRHEYADLAAAFNQAVERAIEETCLPVEYWSPRLALSGAVELTGRVLESFGTVAAYGVHPPFAELQDCSKAAVARLEGMAGGLRNLLNDFSETRLARARVMFEGQLGLLQDLEGDARRLDEVARECRIERERGQLMKLVSQLLRFINEMPACRYTKSDVREAFGQLAEQVADVAATAVGVAGADMLELLSKVLWNVSDLNEGFGAVEARIVAPRVAALRLSLDGVPQVLFGVDRQVSMLAAQAFAVLSVVRWRLTHLEQFYAFDKDLGFLDDMGPIDRTDAAIAGFREVVRGTCEMIAMIGDTNERDGGEPQRMVREFMLVINEIQRIGPGKGGEVLADLRKIRRMLARAIVALGGKRPHLVALEDFEGRFVQQWLRPYVLPGAQAVWDEEEFYEEMLRVVADDGSEQMELVRAGAQALERFINLEEEGGDAEEVIRNEIAGPVGWALKGGRVRTIENWRGGLRAAIKFMDGREISADAALELYALFRAVLDGPQMRGIMEKALVAACDEPEAGLAQLWWAIRSFADRFVPPDVGSVFQEVLDELRGCFRGRFDVAEVNLDRLRAALRGGAARGRSGEHIGVVGLTTKTRSWEVVTATRSSTDDVPGGWSERALAWNGLQYTLHWAKPGPFCLRVSEPAGRPSEGASRGIDRGAIAHAMMVMARHRYQLRPPPVDIGGLLVVGGEPWAVPPVVDFPRGVPDPVFSELRDTGSCENLVLDGISRQILARDAPAVAAKLLEDPGTNSVRVLVSLIEALDGDARRRMSSWVFHNFRPRRSEFLVDFALAAAGVAGRCPESSALAFLVEVAIVAIVGEDAKQGAERGREGRLRVLREPKQAEAMAALLKAIAGAIGGNAEAAKPFGALLSVVAVHSDPHAFGRTFERVVDAWVESGGLRNALRAVKVLARTEFVVEWELQAVTVGRAMGRLVESCVAQGLSEKVVVAFAPFGRVPQRSNARALLEVLPFWARLRSGKGHAYAFLPLVALNYCRHQIVPWWAELGFRDEQGVLQLLRGVVESKLGRPEFELGAGALCNLLWHARLSEKAMVAGFEALLSCFDPRLAGGTFDVVLRALARVVHYYGERLFQDVSLRVYPAMRAVVDLGFALTKAGSGAQRGAGYAILCHVFYANSCCTGVVNAAYEATVEAILAGADEGDEVLKEVERVVGGFCTAKFTSVAVRKVRQARCLIPLVTEVSQSGPQQKPHSLVRLADEVEPPRLKVRLLEEAASLFDGQGRRAEAFTQQLRAVSVAVERPEGQASSLDVLKLEPLDGFRRPDVATGVGWCPLERRLREYCETAGEIAERGGLDLQAQAIRGQVASAGLP